MVIPITNLIFLHPGIGRCSDYESWVDKDGTGCNSYGSSGCENAAMWENADGIDASFACCKCGGGRRGMIIPDSIFCNWFTIIIQFSVQRHLIKRHVFQI